MSNLHNVHGTGGSDERDTETKEEASTHELANGGIGGGSSLDDGPDDNEGGPNGHADLSAPGINGRANEGNGDDGANVVHGGDNTGEDTDVSDIEEVLELFNFQKRVEEGAIESVGGGAEEANQAGEVEDESGGGEVSRRLLDQSGRICLIAADGLDLGNSLLIVELQRMMVSFPLSHLGVVE